MFFIPTSSLNSSQRRRPTNEQLTRSPGPARRPTRPRENLTRSRTRLRCVPWRSRWGSCAGPQLELARVMNVDGTSDLLRECAPDDLNRETPGEEAEIQRGRAPPALVLAPSGQCIDPSHARDCDRGRRYGGGGRGPPGGPPGARPPG